MRRHHQARQFRSQKRSRPLATSAKPREIRSCAAHVICVFFGILLEQIGFLDGRSRQNHDERKCERNQQEPVRHHQAQPDEEDRAHRVQRMTNPPIRTCRA